MVHALGGGEVVLMQFLKGLIAIVCAVISVAAVQAGAYANGKSKPTPRPSPKSTQPQIKVTGYS